MSHVSYPHPHIALRIISECLVRTTWRPLTFTPTPAPIPTPPAPTTTSMMSECDNWYTVSIQLTALQSHCIRMLVMTVIITTCAILVRCGITSGGRGGGG